MSTFDAVGDYAQAVINGEYPAGPIVRNACKRHINNIDAGEDFGFYYDMGSANRAIGFFRDVLKLNGGDFEGNPFELIHWQKFIVGSIFGWKDQDGYRRFQTVFVETGKGSGKSPLAAGIGIYGLVADNESRAEVYAAATKKDQAMILFRDAIAMYNLSPALSKRLRPSGGKGREWNLAYLKTGSFFRPISSDKDGQSGPRPHIALLDEIHEHTDSNMIEMMTAGVKGRNQPIIFMITNSGSNKTSICWEYHEYARQVCDGTLQDESFFSYVCSLDEGDDPFRDESCWAKVNPSMGITFKKSYLENQVKKARGMPSQEAKVRRLNFCQWTEAANPWISADIWLSCKDVNPPQLTDRRCWGGLDLSQIQDLTAFSLVFEPCEWDQFWRIMGWAWLPKEGLKRKSEVDKVPYLAWEDKGHLLTIPGKTIKKDFVVAKVAELCGLYDVQSIGYDRYSIEVFKEFVSDGGYNLPELKEFGQGFKDMPPAVNEFESLLIEGDIKHDGNPVFGWCASNAVTVENAAGWKKPAKDKSYGRIDLMVAGTIAIGASMTAEEKKPTPGVISLG